MYIPFKDKGRGEDGADCWGFGRIIYEKELGIILPSYDDLYDHTVHKGTVSKTIIGVRDDMFETVEKPQPFDFIILRLCGLPMHIGIVTKPNFMVHCSKDVGVSHEKYNGMRWNNKILGFARYAGKSDTALCVT